jgi:hypothetical protein
MRNEWVAPSFVVLTWEEILESEGLQTLEADPRHVQLEDTHGVRIPAQPVRDGGMFWHKRSDIYHGQYERKQTRPVEAKCEGCQTPFKARKGSRFCSRQCQMRVLMRSKRVSANTPKKGEETNQ